MVNELVYKGRNKNHGRDVIFRDVVKECIDVPLRKHYNRGGTEKVKETGRAEASGVIKGKDTEGYL
jgi:hypothetical protein